MLSVFDELQVFFISRLHHRKQVLLDFGICGAILLEYVEESQNYGRGDDKAKKQHES